MNAVGQFRVEEQVHLCVGPGVDSNLIDASTARGNVERVLIPRHGPFLKFRSLEFMPAYQFLSTVEHSDQAGLRKTGPSRPKVTHRGAKAIAIRIHHIERDPVVQRERPGELYGLAPANTHLKHRDYEDGQYGSVHSWVLLEVERQQTGEHSVDPCPAIPQIH